MELKIEYKISEAVKYETIDTSDLGYDEDEWKELSAEKQSRELFDYANNQEMPYWIVNNIEEI